ARSTSIGKRAEVQPDCTKRSTKTRKRCSVARCLKRIAFSLMARFHSNDNGWGRYFSPALFPFQTPVSDASVTHEDAFCAISFVFMNTSMYCEFVGLCIARRYCGKKIVLQQVQQNGS